MEPYIAELINNIKLPKALRAFVLTLITAFIEIICIDTAINGTGFLALPVGGILAMITLMSYVYLMVTIIMPKK